MTPRRLVLALAVLALAACQSPPPRPSFPDLRFNDAPPLLVNVAAIDIRNEDQPTFRPPRVEHLFPVPPARAAENWARDRLKAVGATGRARFTVKKAEVVEVELKKKTEGIRGAFTKDPAQRYDATLGATLDVLDERGVTVRTVTVEASRSAEVLEGATPNEREETWYAMTKALMADFGERMNMEVRNTFGRYLQLP